MAITKTYINGNLTTLKTFLESAADVLPFGEITVSGTTLTIHDVSGNTIATIAGNAITVYADASHNIAGSSSYNMSANYGYKCSNGVMLDFSSSNSLKWHLLIAKTNNDTIAFVVSSAANTTNVVYTSIYSVAWGDAAPLTSFTLCAMARNQTILVPFGTCNALGTPSYTPNAFWIPVGQYYNMGYGTITVDGTTYLTNGYWAIKDEGDAG